MEAVSLDLRRRKSGAVVPEGSFAYEGRADLFRQLRRVVERLKSRVKGLQMVNGVFGIPHTLHEPVSVILVRSRTGQAWSRFGQAKGDLGYAAGRNFAARTTA
jgi:hypothetical protein